MGNSHELLVGVKTGSAFVTISIAVLQKTENYVYHISQLYHSWTLVPVTETHTHPCS